MGIVARVSIFVWIALLSTTLKANSESPEPSPETHNCSHTLPQVNSSLSLAQTDPTAYLISRLGPHQFVIPASEAVKMMKETGWSMETLLSHLVVYAKRLALPPISNYFVGEAGLASSGTIYLGVNLEFPGHVLRETVHGEQFILALMHFHGEKALIGLSLPAEPCGHCRQFMNEMLDAESLIIYTPADAPQTLQSLLPKSFGPKNLNATQGLLDLAFQNLGPAKSEQALDSVMEAALQAAMRSYAPYSRNFAGVALQMSDGKVLSGANLENAAFNPGLSPLQSALVVAHSQGYLFSQIKAAVLAEVPTQASQKLATQNLLASISPNSRFDYVELEEK